MAHLRLFLVLAAMATLGYVAYRQGWVPISLIQGNPTPQPTLGFNVHQRKRPHRFAHGNRNLSEQFAAAGRERPMRAAPRSSSTALAALRPGSNALEIPAAASPSASPAAGPKPPFPRSLEGCWEATVTQPDDWSFNQGPVVKGWSPSNYVLCFHQRGDVPDVSFSTSAEYPVISDWVVSHTGGESGHTQILFSGDDFVVLKTLSRVPLQMKILNLLPGPTGIISSEANFHCTYLPTDKLRVEASIVRRCSDARTIDCDGNVWIRESWHREFSRQ